MSNVTAPGSEGYYTCCGGDIYSNGHTDTCRSRPGCCGKCRFGCMLTENPKRRGEVK